LADPEVTAVSSDIVYEDTGGMTPLTYFDIVALTSFTSALPR
jgi:hypothetical protein